MTDMGELEKHREDIERLVGILYSQPFGETPNNEAVKAASDLNAYGLSFDQIVNVYHAIKGTK